MNRELCCILTMWIVVCANHAFGWPVEIVVQPPNGVRQVAQIGGNIFQPNTQDPNAADKESGVILDRQQTRELDKAEDVLKGNEFKGSEPAATFKSLYRIIQAGSSNEGRDAFLLPPGADTNALHTVGKLRLPTVLERVDRILADMSPEAHRIYQTQYGKEARRLADKAIQDRDMRQLFEVVRLYFHTSAGADAAFALSSYHMNRSEFSTAARILEQLHSLSMFRQRFEPTLTLKLAICWDRCGLDELAVKTLVKFKQQHKDGSVRLQGQTVAVFKNTENALEWLRSVFGRLDESNSIVANEWLLPLGNSERTALSTPSNPVRPLDWQFPVLPTEEKNPTAPLNDVEGYSPDTIDIVTLANGIWKSRKRSSITTFPSIHPLLTDGKIVFRTLNQLAAIDAKTGDLAWLTYSHDDAFNQLAVGKTHVSNMPADNRKMQMQQLLSNRLWRDQLWGMISSDGRYVYSIDKQHDFGRPKLSARVGFFPMAPVAQSNQLTAYDLKSGRLAWELGGEHGEYELNEAGTFFIGPPLSIGNSLLALVQEGGEVRLLEIDANRGGEVVWSQSIAPVSAMAIVDQNRLTSGTNIASDGSIVICPTTIGTIIGVDLARRRLLWQYRYQNARVMSAQQQQVMIFQMRQMQAGSAAGNMTEKDRWFDSIPRIHGGLALLTPHNSNELICLNTFNGELKWKTSRLDGLYLAGIWDELAIVVGRTTVRAIKVKSGLQAWKTPIAEPSGRGLISNGQMLQPLSNGEIASINLKTGMITANTSMPNDRTPGNLVATNGMLVSIAHDGVQAFRPEDELMGELDIAIASSDQDAESLALRGVAKLYAGEIEPGISDLKQSLAINNSTLARRQLVATQMERLRVDFGKYRNSIDEIGKLIEDETTKQRFLRQVARGLLRANEPVAAFRQCLKLTGPTTKLAQASLEDGLRLVRGDAWLAGRYQELQRQGTAGELNEMIQSEFEAISKSKNPNQSLRSFVRSFDGHELSYAARKMLVTKLTNNSDSLERELLWQELSRAADKKVAAAAIATLANLYLETGRFRSAQAAAEQLKQRFSDVVIQKDTTASSVATQISNSPKLAGLDAVYQWPSKFTSVADSIPARSMERAWPVSIIRQGNVLDGWTVHLNYRRTHVIARDSSGIEQWQQEVTGTGLSQPNTFGNTFHVTETVGVLTLGNRFVVMDMRTPSSPSVLWKRNLHDVSHGVGSPTVRVLPVMVGQQRMFRAMDPAGGFAGRLSVIRDDVLCFTVGKDLHCVETMTGDELWKHRNIGAEHTISGDADFLLVQAPQANEASVLSTRDGSLIKTIQLPEKQTMLQLRGRRALYIQNGRDKATLRMIDLTTGKAQWEREFLVSAKLANVSDRQLAVFEHNGRFTILDVESGKIEVTADTKVEQAVLAISVIKTPDQYVLFTSTPRTDQTVLRVDGTTNFQQPVHGPAFGFDRNTGKQIWKRAIDHQSLDIDQPRDLPLLVLSARIQRRNQAIYSTEVNVILLDPRNGKIIHEEEQPRYFGGYEIEPLPAQDQIGVRFNRRMLTITYSNTAPKPKVAPDPDGDSSKEEQEKKESAGN